MDLSHELVEKSYYCGTYNIEFEPYGDVDFTRRCFVFPGQGTLFEGEYREQLATNPILKKRFKSADLLALNLEIDPVSLFINDYKKIKIENLSLVRSLCLFTLEVGLFEYYVDRGMLPEILTGHSFGEFVTLVCAGVVSFEDMFEIILKRDSFSPKPFEVGRMIAVSADEGRIKTILEQYTYYVSNYNSPRQTVISSTIFDVKPIVDKLKSSKVAALILNDVPQPYHTPWLQETSEKLSSFLKQRNYNYNPPEYPFFSSVAKKLIGLDNFNGSEINEIISNQVVSQVDFVSQISSLYDLGSYCFVSVGPHDGLYSFINRTLRGKEFLVYPLSKILNSDNGEVKKEIKFDKTQSKLFKLLVKTIESLTGYELNNISVYDSFQDDLGIDSIKKTEILLTVLKEKGLDNLSEEDQLGLAKIKTMSDVVGFLSVFKNEKKASGEKNINLIGEGFSKYSMEWQKQDIFGFESVSSQSNCMFLDYNTIINESEFAFEKLIHFWEHGENENEKTVIIKPPTVEFGFKDINPDVFVSTFINDLKLFVLFFQKVCRHKFENDQVRRNLILLSTSGTNPTYLGLSSFLKSIRKETYQFFFKHVNIDRFNDNNDIENIINNELVDLQNTDVKYSEGVRYIYKHQEHPKNKNKSTFNNKVIVAVGGAKGITHYLMKQLSLESKNCYIYLCGRSNEDSAKVKENLNEFKRSKNKIIYIQMDASDYLQTEKCLEKVVKDHGEIDVLINGAGQEFSKLLSNKAPEEIDVEISSKVLTTFNILKISTMIKVNYLYNFSSIVFNNGNQGQTIYSCANNIISHMTDVFNTENNRSSANVIHWPAWDGMGMTENIGMRQRLIELGVSLLKPREAWKMFANDLINESKVNTSTMYTKERDIIGLALPLINYIEYEKIIGRLSDVKKTVFMKEISIQKESFFKDHDFNGTLVFPASVAFGMLFCFARVVCGDEEIAFENLQIKNMLTLDSDKTQLKMVYSKDKRKRQVSIETALPHYLCNLCDREKPLSSSFENTCVEKHEYDIKSYYCTEVAYLGPAFRVLSNIYMDENDRIFTKMLCSQTIRLYNIEPYNCVMRCVEFAVQSVAIQILHTYFLLAIPIKIGAIFTYFDQEMTEEIFAKPTVSQNQTSDSDDVIFDVVLFNSHGNAVMAMEEVEFNTVMSYDRSPLEKL